LSVLVTGAAGFIGFHVCQRLLAAGCEVVGVDSLNDYYDPKLKAARLAELVRDARFRFMQIDLAARDSAAGLFDEAFQQVIHLAAQVGVRYSFENPLAYVDSNLVGFMHVLEGCRRTGVEHLVFASSSSVYGGNTRLPFSTHDNVDHPVSLYAATKKANELLAHSYSAMYGLPVTGLRFFTVYGPWGRPDMAMFLFTRAILEGKPIELFNAGEMRRDFTYVDDVVEVIDRALKRPPMPDVQWSGDMPRPDTSFAPYRIYNVGGNRPVELMRLIEVLEECLGKKAVIKPMPLQPGDLPATWAALDDLPDSLGWAPQTPLETGVPAFVSWYRNFYSV
jgi:UDP-glucuronate 4-epimerase